MGGIQGDLSVLSFANLIQALSLDRSSGLLTVDSGLERRVLRVSPEGIRLVGGSQRCRRFESLLRERASDPEGVDEVLPGLATPESVRRLTEAWMLEEVCDLMTWKRGAFQFQEIPEPVPAAVEGPFGASVAACEVARVALEAARWADDLPRIKTAIPDLRHVPVRARARVAPRELPIDAEAMVDVLRLIDGTRPVYHLLQESVFPRFIVLRMLYQLTREEVVRMTVPGRVALARAA